MHQRLCVDYGLVVSRETVRHVLKLLDPDGVERRSQHKLKWRAYSAKGPNFIWHLDGYDILKPFGLCIHGAIDGYSRQILWLEVGPLNNNPCTLFLGLCKAAGWCIYFGSDISELHCTKPSLYSSQETLF